MKDPKTLWSHYRSLNAMLERAVARPLSWVGPGVSISIKPSKTLLAWGEACPLRRRHSSAFSPPLGEEFWHLRHFEYESFPNELSLD